MVTHDAALQARSDIRVRSNQLLRTAAHGWFAVAAVGLWIFASYVALLYFGSALRGDLDGWNRAFPRGYVPGDTLGNLAVGVHVLVAVLVIAGGPLQLIPQIRARFPVFHRWNGRVFLSGAVLASLAGLYLVWVRGGTAGDVWQHLGITLDAVLILAFAGLSLRYALVRNFRAHRRWALRLFLAVNAVWFFRIGLMAWLFVHQAPVGFDPETFSGPFLTFMAFAQTLLPLAILEMYLRAADGRSAAARMAVAGGLFAATVVTGLGIVAATIGLWLPRL